MAANEMGDMPCLSLKFELTVDILSSSLTASMKPCSTAKASGVRPSSSLRSKLRPSLLETCSSQQGFWIHRPSLMNYDPCNAGFQGRHHLVTMVISPRTSGPQLPQVTEVLNYDDQVFTSTLGWVSSSPTT